MTKRYSIYTVVIDNYDSPKSPPRSIRQEIDFFLVSNLDITVNGWQTIKISGESCRDPVTLSRQLKMLYFAEFQQSSISLYLDGNISPNRSVVELFERFEESGKPIGLFPHPKRSSVQEEAAYCVDVGKVASGQAAQKELASYKAEGFQDDLGLFHGGIIFRKVNSKISLAAMRNWNERYNRWHSRDQLSLPVSLWETDTAAHIFDQSRFPLAENFKFFSHKSAKTSHKFRNALSRAVKTY